MATDRDYPFELPINVPSFYMGILSNKIVSAGMWEELPYDLAVKINTAVENNQGMEITREDLDQIPDESWEKALKVLKP